VDQAIDGNLFRDATLPRARAAHADDVVDSTEFDEAFDRHFGVLDQQFEVDLGAVANGPVSTVDDGLTDRQRAILDFEKQWWRNPGAKEQAIRDEFELSATRYYQILNGILDHPAAQAQDPITVGRLRRLRETRGRARGGLPR
jgi:hypothetical protein